MALSRPGRTTTTTVTLNSKLDSGSQRLRKASCLGWPLPQSSRGHWYFKTVILRTSRTVPGNSVSQILRTLTFQDVQTVSIWMPIYIVYNHIIHIYNYIYIWYSSISAIKLCAVAELNTFFPAASRKNSTGSATSQFPPQMRKHVTTQFIELGRAALQSQGLA